MNLLKNALIFPPVLPLLNTIGHISLDTEACDVQVCCVALQQHSAVPQNQLGIDVDLSPISNVSLIHQN